MTWTLNLQCHIWDFLYLHIDSYILEILFSIYLIMWFLSYFKTYHIWLDSVIQVSTIKHIVLVVHVMLGAYLDFRTITSGNYVAYVISYNYVQLVSSINLTGYICISFSINATRYDIILVFLWKQCRVLFAKHRNHDYYWCFERI